MDSIEMAELALSLPEVDPDRPSPARIYDYWLGGSQNFAADREVGRRAAEAMPTLRAAIWANRAFLGRVVRHLAAERGISQFLDLGSGVPTVGNVHEVAQQANPDARIVYVDIDPVAVAHARHLLGGNTRACSILADLRRPEAVLDHPQLHETLDLSRPVAVLMIAVLHFVPDGEGPGRIVRAYLDAVAPGGYLALSHAAPDFDHPREQEDMVGDYNRSTGVTFVNRPPETLASWLDGADIQQPGTVLVSEWRPDAAVDTTPILRTFGVLARKPPAA
jgi:SAM-dependent methyltransferase